MLKTKTLFLKVVVLCSFASLACSTSSAPQFSLNNAGALTQIPKFSDLTLQLAPAPTLAQKKVILPGTDLAPKVEDKIRVDAILQLVSDIYNNASLPYDQDGATFANREGRLPKQALGFYKEYTLLTKDAPHTVVIGGIIYTVAPDLSKRGSERVIIGADDQLYYSPDHYKTFIPLTVLGQAGSAR